jgi:CSLREA domain-containing protein
MLVTHRLRERWVGLLALVVLVVSTAPAHAAIPGALTVNATNDLDDGVCSAFHCSLREAWPTHETPVILAEQRRVAEAGPSTRTWHKAGVERERLCEPGVCGYLVRAGGRDIRVIAGR